MSRSRFSAVLIALLLLGCETTIIESDAERIVTATDCDTIFVDHDSSSSSSASSDSSSESSSSTSSSGGDEESSSSTTGPMLACPMISNGDVAFNLPLAAVTRYVRFTNVNNANGTGPLALYWHGTYESIPSVQTYNPVTDLQAMVNTEQGILALPYPDMMAQADGEPFPWWIVCGAAGMSCNREDDFELAAAVMTCAVEQGLVDSDRLVESGMSAGGIQTSHRIASEDRLAGVVVWSGGVELAYRPTVAAAAGVDAFVLHGGTTDVYPQGCNPAVPPCHSFVEPNEALAIDVPATLTCDHGTGHNAFSGNVGAEFLAHSRFGLVHPWTSFAPNVGAGGWQQFPNMSNGSMWVLRNDCDPF